MIHYFQTYLSIYEKVGVVQSANFMILLRLRHCNARHSGS